MANEEKKDFNAMLKDSKDMSKIQILTDQKSIEKYGGNKMYFAPPIDYDIVMKRIPYGKLTTLGKIREYFARKNQAMLVNNCVGRCDLAALEYCIYSTSKQSQHIC